MFFYGRIETSTKKVNYSKDIYLKFQLTENVIFELGGKDDKST